jgi:hypothetical protein
MSSKLPVTSLIPVLLAAAVVGNLVGKVLEDDKVNVGDLGAIVGSLGEFASFTSLKPGAALAESLDLDDAEKGQVLAAFRQKFDLKDDVTEGAVELLADASLGILVAVAKARQAGKDLLPVPSAPLAA